MILRAAVGVLSALALGVGCGGDESGGPSGSGGSGGSGGDAAVGIDGSSCWGAVCGGECVDVGSSPKHCGGCDQACSAAEVCSLGKCAAACGGGTSACSGACVDLSVDAQHCGACDHACASGQVCSAGACAAGCAAGQTVCAGSCVDTQTSPKHCGACGAGCVLGACLGGKCHCENAAKDGSETDVDCGGACVGCAAGKACQAAADCKSGLACVMGWCGAKDQDLVGSWRFEGNGKDSSGNGHHGALNGATLVAGKVGQGLKVEASKCLTVPDGATLDIVGGTTLSVMAWVMTQGDCAPADRGIILNKEGSYELGIQCATQLFQEAINATGTWEWSGTGAVGAGAWHHVAVTFDGATVRHWVDGAEVFTRALSGALIDQASGLGIGCRGVAADGSVAAAGSWFVGVIDEVALYRRVLSPAEIAAYYQKTK